MKPLRIIAMTLSGIVVAGLISYSIIDGIARSRSAAAMAAGANKFLASLTADQKSKATFEFNDEQRFDWHFIPRARKGVPLKDLNDAQRNLAMDFLKTGLGSAGFRKAKDIISLELVLREIEKRPEVRDPELYYFSVFGTPAANNPWGWRVEGHHMSLNFTVVKGELVSNTPHFFGANPAEVREGERKGHRALAGEEDKGRELVSSLDEDQRATAIINTTAPNDIFTSNVRKADHLNPDGLAAAKMNKKQQSLLDNLIAEYLSNMPEDIAADRSSRIKKAGADKIFFAWAGGINRGDPHYYRVQGPTFLIEYDDTQNNANHIHSVWRDFNGDFGTDLLKEHYKQVRHSPVDTEKIVAR